MPDYRAALGAAVLAIVLAAGVARGAGSPPQEFVDRAGATALYQVRAAELARERAQDEQLREFADDMIAAHSRASAELNSIANDRELMIPSKLDPRHQRLIERLESLEGAEFDREYTQQQLRVQRASVALFAREASAGTNRALRRWAGARLPALQQHLAHVEELTERQNN